MSPLVGRLAEICAALERQIVRASFQRFLPGLLCGLLPALLLVPLCLLLLPSPWSSAAGVVLFIAGATAWLRIRLSLDRRPPHWHLRRLLRHADPAWGARYAPLPVPGWHGDAVWIPGEDRVAASASAHVRAALAARLAPAREETLAEIARRWPGARRPAIGQIGPWRLLLDLDGEGRTLAVSRGPAPLPDDARGGARTGHYGQIPPSP